MRYRKPSTTTSRLRLTLLLLTFCASLYALTVEPNWVESRHYEKSAPGRQSVRIALVTDLHLNSIGYRERSLIKILEQAKPDILVLGGDVVDQSDDLPVLRELLSRVAVPQTVAVLGNWEYWSEMPFNELEALYRENKVALLVNAAVEITVTGRRVRLVGLDDATAGTPRLDVATRAPDDDKAEISILIQHSPGFFTTKSARRDLAGKGFDLCLSGHTHGGQVTIFGWPLGLLPPGSGDLVAGWYETAMCPLYVSRGLGTSLIPVRFFARPEVTLFDL